MFGLCALSKAGFFFSFVFLFSSLGWAQAQQGTVINNGAFVYQAADFDAEIITQLKRGGVYSISKGKRGPFYKIRVKPGLVGWIADSDIQLGKIRLDVESEEDINEQVSGDPLEVRGPKSKPFYATRFRGFSYDYINFSEDTVGGEQSAFTSFFGLKFWGFNTMVSGQVYTESNLLFAFSAPSYYESITKQAAKGYIMMGNILFQTPTPYGPNFLTFFGAGPMLKYSHFDLQLPSGGAVSNYAAEDLTIGAVFNYGFAYKMGKLALRGDIKYYWEKRSYIGAGLALGMDF